MTVGLGDGPRTIAVWRVDLSAGEPPDWSLLDARERAVADAFVYSDDRERYGRTHCALRVLLSDRLGVPPADVPLGVTPSGKPFVNGAAQRVTFNLSHSRKTALIAIGEGTELGIDVEDDDGCTDYSELIDTVFDKETADRIDREKPRRRRQLFLRGWTRKEAIAKASGSGFLVDPKHFPVPLDSAGPWTVRVQHDGADFCLMDLSDAAVVAALAVESFPPRVLVRDYQAEPDRREGMHRSR
jgi:4'-phosphopantetheinyl transferase